MNEEPLITKYRPKSLNDVVGHGTCVERLKVLVKRHSDGDFKLPHLLMTGPPGVGKTTIARALCRDLYGEGWKTYVLEMNASDERGIDVVRGRIKSFASSIATGTGFNIVILDEADHLTPDAQAALRMTMEEYSKYCRFILCANFSNRIIEPLKDRCAYYRFKPLTDGQVASVVRKVIGAEGMAGEVFDSKIARASKGSLRRALNILSQLPEEFNEDDINAVIPSLDNQALKDAMKFAFVGNADQAEHEIMHIVWDGNDISEVLDEMSIIIKDSTLNTKTKVEVLSEIAETEYRILFGCTPGIQLRGLVNRLAAWSKNV